MAFFDFNSLKEKATDLAQSGVNKSKQMAEVTKLKMSNMSEEDNIKKAYQEIGKLYFAEHGTTAEGAYAAACEKISVAKATIDANNERIASMKEVTDAPEKETVVESAAAEVVSTEDVGTQLQEEVKQDEAASDDQSQY